MKNFYHHHRELEGNTLLEAFRQARLKNKPAAIAAVWKTVSQTKRNLILSKSENVEFIRRDQHLFPVLSSRDIDIIIKKIIPKVLRTNPLPPPPPKSPLARKKWLADQSSDYLAVQLNPDRFTSLEILWIFANENPGKKNWVPLLNPAEVWKNLPSETKKRILESNQIDTQTEAYSLRKKLQMTQEELESMLSVDAYLAHKHYKGKIPEHILRKLIQSDLSRTIQKQPKLFTAGSEFLQFALEQNPSVVILCAAENLNPEQMQYALKKAAASSLLRFWKTLSDEDLATAINHLRTRQDQEYLNKYISEEKIRRFFEVRDKLHKKQRELITQKAASLL
jgi:hypothetical protein